MSDTKNKFKMTGGWLALRIIADVLTGGVAEIGFQIGERSLIASFDKAKEENKILPPVTAEAVKIEPITSESEPTKTE